MKLTKREEWFLSLLHAMTCGPLKGVQQLSFVDPDGYEVGLYRHHLWHLDPEFHNAWRVTSLTNEGLFDYPDSDGWTTRYEAVKMLAERLRI